MRSIRPNKNVVTFLVARTSDAKFLRTGNFTRTVGDRVGEWSLLVPLPFTPDGREQWVGVNRFSEFAICIIHETKDSCETVIVKDIGHVLSDLKPILGFVRQRMPKIFTFEMFEATAKAYGAVSVCATSGTATWEESNQNLMICYGRLLEMIPNPNEITVMKNTIKVSNFNSLDE